MLKNKAMNKKIIISKLTLETLNNRRDFGKRFATLDKFAKANKPKEKGKQNA